MNYLVAALGFLGFVRREVLSIDFRWMTLWFGIPTRVRLPSGIVWRAENDASGRAILRGQFEQAECRFVERFLEPGMTVLDIGAHHGFYSLLASRKVAPSGRVISFEPSPREREKLARHLAWNSSENVRVEETALGEADGPADFFVVARKETGCNSLRQPQTKHPTRRLQVQVQRLDEYLRSRQMDRVDFIKLDVEGAELSVLQGAGEIFDRSPRPVLLCEVQDLRTKPWGYSASEIIKFLASHGYAWFMLLENGSLQMFDTHSPKEWDGNFAAVPPERFEQLRNRGLMAI
jgi:FkbM family methyltransferase